MNRYIVLFYVNCYRRTTRRFEEIHFAFGLCYGC